MLRATRSGQRVSDVVLHLQHDAAAFGSERPMRRSWRSAGIHPRIRGRSVTTKRPDRAPDDENLLPIVVDEGLGRRDAGSKADEARSSACLAPLIQIVGKDFNLKPRRKEAAFTKRSGRSPGTKSATVMPGNAVIAMKPRLPCTPDRPAWRSIASTHRPRHAR